MHDERKTIRFTPAQMIEFQKEAHKEKRSISDMVRILSCEGLIERERKKLHDLIEKFDGNMQEPEVIEQSQRLDDLINKL